MDTRHPLQLRLTLPFFHENLPDVDRKFDPILNASVYQKKAYLDAMRTEIENISQDMTDVVVDRINLIYGPATLIDPEDLADLLRTIRTHFPVSPQAEICMRALPGTIHLGSLTTFRNQGISPIFLDIPSFFYPECQEFGFPYLDRELDLSITVLRAANFFEYGFHLYRNVPGREESTWMKLLGQIQHYQPSELHFVPLAQSGKGSDDYPFQSRLQEIGYFEYAPDHFSRNPQGTVNFRPPTGEYLGIGLAAESCLDGYRSTNTADLDHYLAYSGDFQQVTVSLEAID